MGIDKPVPVQRFTLDRIYRDPHPCADSRTIAYFTVVVLSVTTTSFKLDSGSED